MTEIIRATQESENNQYPSLDVIIYDASDFSPRGSLFEESKIKPPYNISDVPESIKSAEDIIEAVLKVRPDSHIEREILGLSSKEAPSELSENPPKRVFPEGKYKILRLNYLRDIFRRNDFSLGDKIAIVSRKNEFPFFIIVDIRGGRFAVVSSYDPDQKDLNLYTNERTAPKRSSTIEDEQKKRKTDSNSITVFERTDLLDKSKVAKDQGERKNYPSETQRFFNRMRKADVEVEYLLINDIETVVAISDAIHRLEKRKGREKTREILQDLRTNGLAGNERLFKLLSVDTEFASKLNSRKHKITPEQIKKGFELLFRSERLYLDAIIDFPWNKVGPEPFDALIEVFWFRFNFITLQNSWEERSLHFKDIKSELYRNAQKKRIFMWANKTQGIMASNLKELRELGITYDMKEVIRVMGPIYKFFDKEKFAERLSWLQKESRPSGLTLLLWKTLKWASASEWKNSKTFYFTDMRHVDPDLWDEKVADPYWRGIGDLQGRLVLPGETLKKPMSHLQSDKSGRMAQMEKEIAWEMEANGDLISLPEVVQEKQMMLRSQRLLKSFESAASDFSQAVSKLSLNKLRGKIDKLSPDKRVVALHRLGYGLGSYKGGHLYSSDTVMYVINLLFNGIPSRYYNAVREIAKSLSTE